jgi:phosphate starvation-inducible protein PhoH and related proteins
LTKTRKPAGPIMLEFSDNALMARLAGPGQKNFVRLEQRLGVRLETRGNLVSLQGEARDTAAQVLRAFYARLERGEAAGVNELDAEIRFAAEPSGEAATASAVKTYGGKLVRARSPMQAAYLEAMALNPLVFGVGPAGTGKTYLAAAFGAALLKQRQVERLILSRPAIEAGERLGFLPGDLKEKVDPYLRPLYDALYEVMGDARDKLIEQGVIEVAPLAFMRGRTLSRAFVILDEAQNCTTMQMKMFLTRLGEDSRMVVTGDPSQSDLADASAEGLRQALELLDGVEAVAVVRFGEGDVVRHPLVTRIVAAYNAAEKKAPRPGRKTP